MSDKLEKHKDRALLFVEAAYIAINMSDEASALKLFKAADLLSPGNELIEVGYGYLYLCKLELKKAVEYFDKAIAKDTHNEMAISLKGLALTMTPDRVSEGEKLLSDLSSKSGEEDVKKLSNMTLEFVDKYVKNPSPSDLKPKQK